MANISQSNDSRFFEKVANFPRNLYKVDDRNSNIFKFLYSILENGVGQLKSIQDIANQAQQSLAGTESTDLDEFYQIFGIKRESDSIYNGTLFSDVSVNELQDFKSSDAKFRIRIAKVLQAMQKGGTAEGLRLMAEAASSLPVHVIEPWQNISSFTRVDSNNEVIVVILANRELNDEELQDLKSRVIGSLEMIRPAGTLITVKVLNPESDEEEIVQSDYAATGSFMFLSDGTNEYVELLSQEKEIEINSFVVNANPFVVDSKFATTIGTLVNNGDLDSGLIVQETTTPLAPVFLALLSDGDISEIVFVFNRFTFEQDEETLSLYEVTRAQMGSTQIDWNDKEGVTLKINLVKANSSSEATPASSDNLVLQSADSPDNYPYGKYEGDPSRYDENGNYIFEWSSQAEYEAWVQDQLIKAGGEYTEDVYKMPGVVTLSGGDTLIAALGPSFKVIRPIITPKQDNE